MRVVFDTNVVLSGVLWGGKPQQALEAIAEGYAVLVSSDELVNELHDVLSRPKFTAKIEAAERTVEQLLQRYQSLVETVVPAEIAKVVQDDPKDDKFIACALGGEADLIVSGDKHLLTLGIFQGIEIITVDDFLVRIGLSS